MTASTGNRPVVFIRRIVLQQLGERRSSRMVHGGADGRFDVIQIKAASLVVLLKDDA